MSSGPCKKLQGPKRRPVGTCAVAVLARGRLLKSARHVKVKVFIRCQAFLDVSMYIYIYICTHDIYIYIYIYIYVYICMYVCKYVSM